LKQERTKEQGLDQKAQKKPFIFLNLISTLNDGLLAGYLLACADMTNANQ